MTCLGNNGRSPIAELIAHNTLEDMNLLNKYRAISSGTLVNAINTGNFPIKGMKPVIDVAMNRDDGVYNTTELKELETALKDGDTKTVKKYFNQAAAQFAQEEQVSRGIALKEFKISGDVKKTPTQTIITPNTVALYTMDKGNYDRANIIYENSDNKPLIMKSLDVESSFGLKRDAYMAGVEKLLRVVPEAVKRAVIVSAD